MTRQIARVGTASAAVVLSLALIAPAARAAPSCVAQINAEERHTYGTAWGSDVVSFVARNPDLLDAATFGEIAAFLAHGDSAACPQE